MLEESTALNGVPSYVEMLEGYACASVPERYRIMATGNPDLMVQEAIVILSGTDHVSGFAELSSWDYDVDYYDCDYGRGFSSVIMGRGLATPEQSEEFKRTVAHEFGHSFAKLADEYRSRIIFGGTGNPQTRKYAPTIIYPVDINELILRLLKMQKKLA